MQARPCEPGGAENGLLGDKRERSTLGIVIYQHRCSGVSEQGPSGGRDNISTIVVYVPLV